MIDDLKPFPDYKDSGLPWLGKIPIGWEVRRNGRLFSQRNETGYPELPILEVSLRTGVRVRDFDSSKRKQVIAEKEKYKRACRGDIAYNMMRMWQGAVGVAPVDGLISPAYIVARPMPETQARYFTQLFCTDAYKNVVNIFSRGIVSDRNRLYWEDFKQIPSPFPPLDEQAAIVRYLDHANGKIERAIRAKRKLIVLLNEQKQVIIHRAVTRGLDPAVKLKPSGIPWLKDSPTHWHWVPIKRLLSRIDYGTSEASREDGQIRILTMGNIQRGEVILPKSGGLDEVPKSLLLEHNDILFTRTNGNPDLVGKVGLFRGHLLDNVSFASYLVRLRAKSSHDPRWLHCVLHSSTFWSFARSHALVNLQTNLNSTRYSQFHIPVPPLHEQQQIVGFIEVETYAMNTAVARTEREIKLLREYRTTLTADVVTGKVDVREAAKRLPSEVEELPSADDLPDEIEEDTESEV